MIVISSEDPYYCGFTARVPQYNLPQVLSNDGDNDNDDGDGDNDDGDNDDDDDDNDNEEEKDDINDVSGEGCCPSRARWPGYRHH